MFEEQLDWKPSRIMQVEELAKSINISQSLDAIAHHVSGGPFCRRASGISSTATPTRKALQHRSLRASLFWKFSILVSLSPSSSVADRRATSEHHTDDNRQRRLAAEGSVDRPADRRAEDSRQRRPAAEGGLDRTDRSRSSYRDSSSSEHR